MHIAFATLPSYSVNLVCHLPFEEVEAFAGRLFCESNIKRTVVDACPYGVPEVETRMSVPTNGGNPPPENKNVDKRV